MPQGFFGHGNHTQTAPPIQDLFTVIINRFRRQPPHQTTKKVFCTSIRQQHNKKTLSVAYTTGGLQQLHHLPKVRCRTRQTAEIVIYTVSPSLHFYCSIWGECYFGFPGMLYKPKKVTGTPILQISSPGGM